ARSRFGSAIAQAFLNVDRSQVMLARGIGALAARLRFGEPYVRLAKQRVLAHALLNAPRLVEKAERFVDVAEAEMRSPDAQTHEILGDLRFLRRELAIQLEMLHRAFPIVGREVGISEAKVRFGQERRRRVLAQQADRRFELLAGSSEVAGGLQNSPLAQMTLRIAVSSAEAGPHG